MGSPRHGVCGWRSLMLGLLLAFLAGFIPASILKKGTSAPRIIASAVIGVALFWWGKSSITWGLYVDHPWASAHALEVAALLAALGAAVRFFKREMVTGYLVPAVALLIFSWGLNTVYETSDQETKERIVSTIFFASLLGGGLWYLFWRNPPKKKEEKKKDDHH